MSIVICHVIYIHVLVCHPDNIYHPNLKTKTIVLFLNYLFLIPYILIYVYVTQHFELIQRKACIDISYCYY